MPYTGLLLACRQLFRETRRAQKYLRIEDEYRLDVMFVREAGIWPTWTYAPAPKKHIDTVRETFRLFNVPEKLKGDSNWCDDEQFRVSTDHTSHAMSYFDLLASYLQKGPALRTACRDISRAEYTIGTLVIDVIPPEVEDIGVLDRNPFNETRAYRAMTLWDTLPDALNGMLFASRNYRFSERSVIRDNDPPAVFAAAKLCYFIGDYIKKLTSLGTPYVKYGRLLLDGVRRIEMRVARELRNSHELWRTMEQPVPRLGPGNSYLQPSEAY